MSDLKPLREFRILTFDVVGTLIDFEAGVLNYIKPIAAGVGVAIDDETILASYGKAEGEQHHIMPGVPFIDMLPGIYLAMANNFGLPNSAQEVEGFRESLPSWPAFADSVAALKSLRQHFRLVAMTNSNNWALGYFSRTLGEPFHDTVTAEDVGTCKPDPQFFAYARGRQSVHGFKLSDYLHVAQSQYHDIGVARELGYATCWIERRRGCKGAGGTPEVAKPVTPDYHFASLAELSAAVENG
jgi:putative hydrolase of the HAD superfamily